MMKLIPFPELKSKKGIDYQRDHLRRKCRAGEFPQPVSLSPTRIAWIEQEVDDWLAQRAAEREPIAPQQAGPKPRDDPEQPEGGDFSPIVAAWTRDAAPA